MKFNSLFCIVFIFVYSSHLLAFKNSQLILELGDKYKLPAVKNNIWVENQKILKINLNKNQPEIQTLSIGSSRIKTDQKLTEIIVLPPGQIESYSKWNSLALKFADLNVGFCLNMMCLHGRLTTFIEFKKMMNLMKTENKFVYFGMTVHPELMEKIQNWYADQLKNEGLPPHKIIFSKPWKVFSSTSENQIKNSLFFEKLGLLAIEDKTKIELSPNLKVEIKVVEIKKDLARQWGIKWPEAYSAQLINSQLESSEAFELSLHASERSGDVNILASPNLMCKSGKEATFFAGGEFPIKTIGEKFSSVSWKPYGINLKIKPQVDSIGQISLEIESEVSTIDKSREVDGIPALQSHKVSSHFDLKSSKTIVLSGLIKSESGNSYEGLPFLSQIPILGRLFSSQSFLDHKSELVIFVTPLISGN